jgi:hypothetical protein
MRPARTTSAAALLVLAIAAIAHAQSQIFFTEYKFNDPRIRSIGLDGANPQELFPLAAAEWLPVGIAYDAAAGKIYWTNGTFNAGIIRRANLDGSANQPLLSALKIARGLAVDPVHGKLYFSDAPPQSNDQVLLKRANLDGTDVEVIHNAAAFVGRPSVDVTNQRIYFGSDGQIKSAALDGSDVRTVVTGVSTPYAVQVDVAAELIYWSDGNTNSDFIGRARLDNTDFTVLVDSSPNVVGSSGLQDILLDRANSRIFFTDEDFGAGTATIERANVDGTGHTTIFTAVSGFTPSALAFNAALPQPVADCNGNTVPDATDIALGQSADCNANLFPDECEADPCPALNFLLDNGSDAASTQGRALGWPSQWEVFQPFDVPAGGWSVGQVGVDGFTSNYADGTGFTATLFPDNGQVPSRPDETMPIASASGYNFRFNVDQQNWVYRPLAAQLPEGRHWVRLTAENPTVYSGAVNHGTSGLPSLSRGSSGNFTQSSFSLAIRIVEQVECPHTGDMNTDGAADGADIQGFTDAVVAASTLPADLCPGDFDDSGVLDPPDIQPFVAALLGA